MPTLEQNKRLWINPEEWVKGGDQWSEAFGGVDAEWHSAIYPRIRAFVPAPTILEIAPGFGRWTNYLRTYADRLIVVDLVSDCIDACRKRFASDSHIEYHVNDGRSLAMIPDESIDFAFSFDSLVHAESDVIDAYLTQLARKLKPGGAGFFHHSNIGEYRTTFALFNRIQKPRKLRGLLRRMRVVEEDNWRAFSVTAEGFERTCEKVGLQCIRQELVNWNSSRLIDSFSTFVRKESPLARPNRVHRNPTFMRDTRRNAVVWTENTHAVGESRPASG